MSLNWSVAKVLDYETLHRDTYQSALTKHLVWCSYSIDLGEITQKNVDEWLIRIAMWEKVCDGGITTFPGKVTKTDLLRRVGLTTNVVTRSKAYFDKKCMKVLRERTERVTITNYLDNRSPSTDNNTAEGSEDTATV